MNDLVHLKGRLTQIDRQNQNFGPPIIPQGEKVSVSHLLTLKDELNRVYEEWQYQDFIEGALVEIHYRQVIAKSNRVARLLKQIGHEASDSVVGARFDQQDNKPYHVVTHFVPLTAISESVESITRVIEIIEYYFQDEVTHLHMKQIESYKIPFEKFGNLSKSAFRQIIKDAYYVMQFDIPYSELAEVHQIVTLYDVADDMDSLLRRIGVNVLRYYKMDRNTYLLDNIQIQLLNQQAPYLISMATKDLSELDIDFNGETENEVTGMVTIPDPTNEPIIGVIDTLFDDSVYFSNWVEYHDMVDEGIPKETRDYNHGTAVSSIIVDGPTINPELDDGCGRFKVRHFGIATQGQMSSFQLMQKTKRIVMENPDIKVWNFSLGSTLEINWNSISPEAYVLDQLQKEHEVIFVVSGTNDNEKTKRKRIGAPADSLNSLVVNSVNQASQPASYSRTGPVLSFFNKPDVSYFGGDEDRLLRTCSPLGERMVTGTSYATPLVTRKLAYLIHKLGFSREVAKALIIDSSMDWEGGIGDISLKGYGVVPIRIEEVIQGQDDEIKFVINGISQKHKTYNYNIPIPSQDDKHPYIARATMCYFPNCSRQQGVDYTDTELNLKFGRINDTNQMISVDNDNQLEIGHWIYEDEARSLYRKWDNVKHIREIYNERKRSKKKYSKNPNWGIEVLRSSRLNNVDTHIPFGMVVTLKEINGVNRMESFIQQCSLQGWLVQPINIEQQVDIYNMAQEELEFDL